MDDSCLLEIVVPGLPPGTNRLHMPGKGPQKVILTPQARAFNKKVREIAARLSYYDQAALKKNANSLGYVEVHRERVAWVKAHQKSIKLCLTLHAYLRTEAMDIDAPVKQVQDRLLEIIGINDKFVWEQHIFKSLDPAHPRIEARLTWIRRIQEQSLFLFQESA